MITGLHGMFYTSEPEETRAFLRDKLQIPNHDVGGGWLIFNLPHGEVGCHPTGQHPDSPPSGAHDLSFTCDDIHRTVEELRSRGVEGIRDIDEQDWGSAIHLEMPGGIKVQIYQPKYGHG